MTNSRQTIQKKKMLSLLSNLTTIVRVLIDFYISIFHVQQCHLINIQREQHFCVVNYFSYGRQVHYLVL